MEGAVAEEGAGLTPTLKAAADLETSAALIAIANRSGECISPSLENSIHARKQLPKAAQRM